MIYKESTKNKTIKALKAKLGLTGDVYVINEHIMESLESHKRLFPESEVSTIEEAEAERLAKIEEERRPRKNQRKPNRSVTKTKAKETPWLFL